METLMRKTKHKLAVEHELDIRDESLLTTIFELWDYRDFVWRILNIHSPTENFLTSWKFLNEILT